MHVHNRYCQNYQPSQTAWTSDHPGKEAFQLGDRDNDHFSNFFSKHHHGCWHRKAFECRECKIWGYHWERSAAWVAINSLCTLIVRVKFQNRKLDKCSDWEMKKNIRKKRITWRNPSRRRGRGTMPAFWSPSSWHYWQTSPRDNRRNIAFYTNIQCTMLGRGTCKGGAWEEGSIFFWET